MTHYGLPCPAASGHLNPMTTLGHELRRRCHRVTLVGIVDGRSAAEAAGLDFQGSTAMLRRQAPEAFGPWGRRRC
jgi:zeaxanthin glucosyltransferase